MRFYTQTKESLEQFTEELAELRLKVAKLTKELEKNEQQLRSQTLRLSHRMEKDSKVAFYTGFPSYEVLDACYTFLGPYNEQFGTYCLQIQAQ